MNIKVNAARKKNLKIDNKYERRARQKCLTVWVQVQSTSRQDYAPSHLPDQTIGKYNVKSLK